MAANVAAPMMYGYSGEITGSVNNQPLGAAVISGKISGISLSVEASGKDDTNTLSFDGDILINGTTCLTTKPVIAHVSGEASQQKTTMKTGDTGITQAVLDQAANSISQGDVISCTFNLTRTASPTTEMQTPCVVVEFEPSP
jgi:hypothetical protein